MHLIFCSGVFLTASESRPELYEGLQGCWSWLHGQGWIQRGAPCASIQSRSLHMLPIVISSGISRNVIQCNSELSDANTKTKYSSSILLFVVERLSVCTDWWAVCEQHRNIHTMRTCFTALSLSFPLSLFHEDAPSLIATQSAPSASRGLV